MADRLDARRVVEPLRLLERLPAEPNRLTPHRHDEERGRQARRQPASEALCPARRGRAPPERWPPPLPLARGASRRRRDGRAASAATDDGRPSRCEEPREPLVLLRVGAPRVPEAMEKVSCVRRLDSGRRRSGDRASPGGCPPRPRTRRGSPALLVPLPVRIVRLQPVEVPAGVTECVLGGLRRPRRAAPGRTRAASRAGRSARRRAPSADCGRGAPRAGRDRLP